MSESKINIHPSVLVADGAKVIGKVTVKENASIWYNAVLRADIGDTEVIVGRNTNVQDGSVVHVDYGKSAIIGDNVTIGHNCTIHACTIEDDCLIGMGAVVLSGAVIKKGAVVAAGSVVKENDIVEPGVLYAGIPAKKIKEISDQAKDAVRGNMNEYVKLAAEHIGGKYEKL